MWSEKFGIKFGDDKLEVPFKKEKQQGGIIYQTIRNIHLESRRTIKEDKYWGGGTCATNLVHYEKRGKRSDAEK